MPAPALRGAALSAALFAARSPARGALWQLTARDFRLHELLALPPSSRAPLDSSPCPVRARSDGAQWEDGGHTLPVAPGTAAALRANLASGATTPADLVTTLQRRLQDGDLGNALHSPMIAMRDVSAEAEASARRWAAGAPLSDLDGIPVPVKDEVDLTGLPTRGGTRWRNEPATQDAWTVQRLKAAGALVIGKTHATEWGMNPLGFSDHYHMPRSAMSRDHGAGGSSTGSGAAVGIGLCPVALGSDGGGSIRIPAAFNGVRGLKPTFTRLGMDGDFWGHNTVSVQGPIGRSTADLVAFLSVTAGASPGDPNSHHQPNPDPAAWRRALGRGVRGCRIGLPHQEWADADPAWSAASLDALRALEREGATLVDVDIPLAPFAPGLGAAIIASETTANISDDLLLHRAETGLELQLLFELLRNLGARELLLACRERAALRRQTAAALRLADVLALPTTNTGPAPYPDRDSCTPIVDTARTAAATRFAFLANLTGLPAVAFPTGTHQGLPVSLQIVGDAWDEASVLAVSAHAERLGIGA